MSAEFESPSLLATLLTWGGIAIAICHSAMFSGLNLGCLGTSRLRLEVQAADGNRAAQRMLHLRGDANLLLTTILWGNVAANVVLTLLSDSVLTGLAAFFFSTFLITFLGEIVPQAYCSRHALAVVNVLYPVLTFYRIVLYPVAKPSAMLLDAWLGEESITYFRERDLKAVLKRHVEAEESDVGKTEGLGAINFLTLDDIPVSQEGERIAPDSVISLPFENRRPVFPAIDGTIEDPFLQQIQSSGKRWVIFADTDGEPQLVVDSDEFLRGALFDPKRFNPHPHCHRPVIVRDEATPLGKVIWRLKVEPVAHEDDVIDDDIILVWSDSQKRIITGADILGRLLRGIVRRDAVNAPPGSGQ